MFAEDLKNPGGFSMCSPPSLMRKKKILQLAVKYSQDPAAYWVHKKVFKSLLNEVYLCCCCEPQLNPLRITHNKARSDQSRSNGWDVCVCGFFMITSPHGQSHSDFRGFCFQKGEMQHVLVYVCNNLIQAPHNIQHVLYFSLCVLVRINNDISLTLLFFFSFRSYGWLLLDLWSF